MVWPLIIAGAATVAGAGLQAWQAQDQQKRAARAAASQAFGGPRVRPEPDQSPSMPTAPQAMAPMQGPMQGPPAPPFSSLPQQATPASVPNTDEPRFIGPRQDPWLDRMEGPYAARSLDQPGIPTNPPPRNTPFWTQAALAGGSLAALGGIGALLWSSNPRADKVGGTIPGYRGIPGGGVMEEEQRYRQIASFLQNYRPQGSNPGFGYGG